MPPSRASRNSLPPQPASGGRLAALDLFRGLTVVGMIFVNNPGDWGHLYWPFDHAEWHGWTPTDLIFPWFLFIVGVAGVFSLEKRMAQGADRLDLARHAFRRGMTIVVVGWLMAFYPFVPFLERLPRLRIPGVLPRIGVVVRPRNVDRARRVEAPRRRESRSAVALLLALHTWILLGTGFDLTPAGERAARRGPRGAEGPSLEERAGLGPRGDRLDADRDRDDAHGDAHGLLPEGRRDGPAEGRAPPRLGRGRDRGGPPLGTGAPDQQEPLDRFVRGLHVRRRARHARDSASSSSTSSDGRGRSRSSSRSARTRSSCSSSRAFSPRRSASSSGRTRPGKAVTLHAWLYRGGFSWIADPTLRSHAFALVTIVFWWAVLRVFEKRGWFWKI